MWKQCHHCCSSLQAKGVGQSGRQAQGSAQHASHEQAEPPGCLAARTAHRRYSMRAPVHAKTNGRTFPAAASHHTPCHLLLTCPARQQHLALPAAARRPLPPGGGVQGSALARHMNLLCLPVQQGREGGRVGVLINVYMWAYTAHVRDDRGSCGSAPPFKHTVLHAQHTCLAVQPYAAPRSC